jgi:hypothetical protein
LSLKRDLAVPGLAIERVRLGERLVGIKHDARGPKPHRFGFECRQQGLGDSLPACRGRHPHALDLERGGVDALERAAGDRLGVAQGEIEDAGILGIGIALGARIEAALETPVELGEIGGEARARRRRVGRLGADVERAHATLADCSATGR